MDSIIQFLSELPTWVVGHPITVAVVAYMAWNISARIPPPKDPILYWLWDLSEKLCFLAWGRWGGPLKPLLASSDPSRNPKPPVLPILAVLLLCSHCSWLSGAVPSDARARAIRDVQTTIETVRTSLAAIESEWHAICKDDNALCRKESDRYAATVESVRHALSTADALLAAGAYPSMGRLLAVFSQLTYWISRVSATRYGLDIGDTCESTDGI